MTLRLIVLGWLVWWGAPAALADGVLGSESTSASEISGNLVRESGVERATELSSSFSGHRGLAHINESAGVLNHQANLRSIAIGAGAIAAADHEIESVLSGNQIEVAGGRRENRIIDSFADTRGIVGVNQASGIATRQTNSLALSIDTVSQASLEAGAEAPALTVAKGLIDVGAAALDDQALEELVSGNEIQSEPDLPRHEALTDSFTDFRGIAQVSQSAGDLNQISNRAAIAVTRVSP